MFVAQKFLLFCQKSIVRIQPCSTLSHLELHELPRAACILHYFHAHKFSVAAHDFRTVEKGQVSEKQKVPLGKMFLWGHNSRRVLHYDVRIRCA